MSIVQTQTTSFKAELYQGVHNLLTDTIYVALYTGYANLNAATTVYTNVNEITGTGYTAGGQIVTGATVNSSDYTAYVNFNNVIWTNSNLTARCALFYNVSKGNKSIFVLDFGSDKTQSNFTITMPVNGPTTAIIRSSN
jgi:coproporphyrinogen III oxidase-like Fe-S oxidoreductase